MEIVVKAKRIGGSIAVIVPKEIVERERIVPEDTLKIHIVKTADLRWLWGRWRNVKKSTQQIMEEIDEGEDE